jgi:hypothetical protein
VADFVAKKREMFLVQMSLDVKKAEIVKLDEKAKQKDEALKKSQQLLDEDVSRFDAFLSANDQKAHKAMKNAEDMTKKKQDKMLRIKQLKSQLSAIQSEIAKLREQKEECIKFKSFLEKLTPQEWKDQKVAEKSERKRQRKVNFISRRMAEITTAMQNEIDAEEKLQEEKETKAPARRRQKGKEAEEEAKEREREAEARRRRIRKKYPTQDAVEAEYEEVSSGEEDPLYFEEPKQLLDVFTSLEESNLFLIQNSQDTEQALEELQQTFTHLKQTRGTKTSKMRWQKEQLERHIAEEQHQCTELKQMVSQEQGSSEHRAYVKELEDQVVEVLSACGHEVDKDTDALKSLGIIEKQLEDFLTVLEDAENSGMRESVEELEKKKEKERRETVRKQRREAEERKIQRRLDASLQRSEAPIHKKVGKPIMFRSRPLTQAKRVEEEDDGYEDACKEHTLFGIWIGKEGIPEAGVPKKE